MFENYRQLPNSHGRSIEAAFESPLSQNRDNTVDACSPCLSLVSSSLAHRLIHSFARSLNLLLARNHRKHSNIDEHKEYLRCSNVLVTTFGSLFTPKPQALELRLIESSDCSLLFGAHVGSRCCSDRSGNPFPNFGRIHMALSPFLDISNRKTWM